MDVNNRFQRLIKKLNMNASEFSEAISVQPSSISHILSGRNKPSLDLITKIHTTFQQVNINWLLFGEGDVFTDSQSKMGHTSEDKERLHRENLSPTPLKKIIQSKEQEQSIEKIVIFYANNTFKEYNPG